MGLGWWLDSGATNHMSFQRELFRDLTQIEPVAITTADKTPHYAMAEKGY